jgi:hypothetical protein
MTAYEVVRTTEIAAEPADVHALVNGFRSWAAWSPWEDLDPELERTYTGPETGIGAHYAWRGNRKAGAGSMEITGSAADRIQIRLAFLRPFASTTAVTFTFTPSANGTTVEWRMNGEQTGLWGLVGRVVPMDRLIGKDFEKGLARLKAVAES